jgi:arylformamidase
MKLPPAPDLRPAAADIAALAAYYDSQYNNRLRVPHAPELLARWTAQSAQGRSESPRLREFGYGAPASERLDFFPAQTRDRPLVVFIHGGYWRSLDKDDFSFIAPAFAQADLNLAIVNYSLAPEVSVRKIVQQMIAALAWLYRNAKALGANPKQIHVIGHSAGGHLSAMMLAVIWKQVEEDLPRQLVKSAVAISGLFDMRPIAQCPYLNVDLRLNEAEAIALSPALMPPASRAPLLVAVGAEESAEFHWQTAAIKTAWGQHTRVSGVAQPGHNHFTICEALADPSSPLFRAALGHIDAKD